MSKLSSTWIFAYLYKGEYIPEELFENDTDLQNSLDNLEYIDAKNAQYQVWEFPSGKIFDIQPDRVVQDKDINAVPYSTSGIVWLPILVQSSIDKIKVRTALEQLTRL